ncbi:MAG: DUF3090 family protein [Acidimicrobiia bacterium]
MIEFDPVDRIMAGALGDPGRRTFVIQAAKDDELLTVVLEKEQVAALSIRLLQLLTALEAPEGSSRVEVGLEESEDPLFRARMLRVGFDAARDLVLLELYEQVPEDLEEEPEDLPGTGWMARLFVDLGQARAMATRGAEAVAAGRPVCRMCWLPMDPEGHLCPALN